MEKLGFKVPFTSALAGIKDISERNEAFDKLTDKEKRREIAFEGLNLVVSGQLRAVGAGMYYWNENIHRKTENAKNSAELQDILRYELDKGCAVCQRGLMMVSLIRLGNRIDPSDPDKNEGCKRNIRGFTMLTMVNMEMQYENNTSIYNTEWYDDDNFEQKEYPHQRGTDNKLMNICCNVIANGDYNDQDTTDYLVKWGCYEYR